jgi:hypothetical protein
MRSAPGLSSMIWTYRFLTALLLWACFPTSMLGQSKDYERSHYSTEDWALPWTVLTIAPDGSWGVATEIYSYQALAGAIANCKRMYQKEIGCGHQSTATRAGWSLAVRCGDQNIIVAAKILADAIQAAADRETILRQDYRSDMPTCMHVLTVNPQGIVTRHNSETSWSASAIRPAGTTNRLVPDRFER